MSLATFQNYFLYKPVTKDAKAFLFKSIIDRGYVWRNNKERHIVASILQEMGIKMHFYYHHGDHVFDLVKVRSGQTYHSVDCSLSPTSIRVMKGL